MAKPYCEVEGCKKEFKHYHCPNCNKGFESLQNARCHGGEKEFDGRPPIFMSQEDGPHPDILKILPQLCKWKIMIDIRGRGDAVGKRGSGAPIMVPRQCELEDGHEPSQWRKDGHYFGLSIPKNAKAFLPDAEGKTPAPVPEVPVPEGLKRVKIKKCPDCEEEFTDDEPLSTEPKYECNSCGNEFLRSESDNGNHVCPECHKWAAKQGEDFHEDCGGNLEEAEEFEKFVCDDCDEEFDNLEDAKEHLKPVEG